MYNEVEHDTHPVLQVTDMRQNQEYKVYYINWTRNIITGILPIASLIIFNQLVYNKLVKRRALWKQGNFYNTKGLYIHWWAALGFTIMPYKILQDK